MPPAQPALATGDPTKLFRLGGLARIVPPVMQRRLVFTDSIFYQPPAFLGFQIGCGLGDLLGAALLPQCDFLHAKIDPPFCCHDVRQRIEWDPRLKQVNRQLNTLYAHIGSLENRPVPLPPQALPSKIKQIHTWLFTRGEINAEAAWQFMQRMMSPPSMCKDDFKDHVAV